MGDATVAGARSAVRWPGSRKSSVRERPLRRSRSWVQPGVATEMSCVMSCDQPRRQARSAHSLEEREDRDRVGALRLPAIALRLTPALNREDMPLLPTGGQSRHCRAPRPGRHAFRGGSTGRPRFPFLGALLRQERLARSLLVLIVGVLDLDVQEPVFASCQGLTKDLGLPLRQGSRQPLARLRNRSGARLVGVSAQCRDALSQGWLVEIPQSFRQNVMNQLELPFGRVFGYAIQKCRHGPIPIASWNGQASPVHPRAPGPKSAMKGADRWGAGLA